MNIQRPIILQKAESIEIFRSLKESLDHILRFELCWSPHPVNYSYFQKKRI